MQKGGGGQRAGVAHFSKRAIGDWGEAQASDFLLRRGFKIIERNFFARVGEIDIIAARVDTLYFIEVKTRLGTGFGSHEAVDFRKQSRLQKAAKIWLARREFTPTGQATQFEKIVLAVLVVLANPQTKKVKFYWFPGWGA